MPVPTTTRPVPRPAVATTATAVVVADPPSWAARRANPALEGRPVLVSDGRRVVGADAMARRVGATVGEHLGRARGLCPEAAVVPHDPPTLRAAWEAAVEAAYRVTPFLEPAGVGLLFAGGLDPLEADALAVELDARIGLARSRGTAHLAALAAAEVSARRVRDDDRFLEQAPCYLLRGAGMPSWVVDRLVLFGLPTLGHLRARATARQLGAQFGPLAVRLWALAWGKDDAPVGLHTPPEEAAASFDFDHPAAEPGDWLPVLERLVGEAAAHLGERLPRSVTVTVRTAFAESAARHVLKAPTRQERALLVAAERALGGAVQPGLEVERLGLSLGGLHRPAPRQESLFGLLERPGVRAALEKVEGRYPGSLKGVELVDEGAYLPEDRFRYVPLADLIDRPAPRRGRRKTA